MRKIIEQRWRPAPVVAVLAIALGACSEGTSPAPGIPQIAGRYSVSESVPVATCTPNQPPPGGIVIIEAFNGTYQLQVEQNGSSLRLIDPDFPEDVETGTIDADGNIQTSIRILFEETPRAGNRIFFVDLTYGHTLKVQSNGSIKGTMSAVNLFREGSSTAPLYTTCSRQGGSVTLTRLAG